MHYYVLYPYLVPLAFINEKPVSKTRAVNDHALNNWGSKSDSWSVRTWHFLWSLINRHLFQVMWNEDALFHCSVLQLFVHTLALMVEKKNAADIAATFSTWTASRLLTPMLTAALRRRGKINNAAPKMQIWSSDVLQMSIITPLLLSQHASKGEILSMTQA